MSYDTKGKALKMACKAFDASLLNCATWRAQERELQPPWTNKETLDSRPARYGEARDNLRKFEEQRDAWKYVITLILEDETS